MKGIKKFMIPEKRLNVFCSFLIAGQRVGKKAVPEKLSN